MYRIIATFIIIYLIFRVLTTWVFPMIVKWYLKRYKKKFYEQNPHLRQDDQQRAEGDVHISIPRDEGNPGSNKIGEYVDYEEIKDNNKK
jgi:hypothetical protein